MICHLEWIKNDRISKFNAIKTPKQHEIKTVHRSFFLSLKSLIPTLQQKSEQQKCATEKKRDLFFDG